MDADVDPREGDEGGEQDEGQREPAEEVGQDDRAGEARRRVSRREGQPDVRAQKRVGLGDVS